MKKLKSSEKEAFVFRLWEKEVFEDKLSEREAVILELWKKDAITHLDMNHIQESKVRILSGLTPYFKHTAGHPIYFRKKLYSVAAILLILFSLGGFFTYQFFVTPDIYIAEQINRKITLKDGSVVTLMPGARLTVKKTFPAETRLVNLQGDAIFSVAKSKTHPFIVQAEGFSTKVMGTVFKVIQKGSRKSVDLYEGKVAVSSPGASVSYLIPNQQWTNFGMSRTSAVVTYKKDQRSGKKVSVLMSLTFNDVSVKQVMEVLHKNYGINITYPQEVADKKITADLTGSSWDENVEALAFIMGLEVQKENNTTYILKK